MKKQLVVFISIAMLVAGMHMVQSCNPCGSEGIYFRTEAISASTQKITGIDTSGCCDAYRFEKFYPEEKVIRYDSLLIQVKSDIQTVFNDGGVSWQFGVGSAKACSPAYTHDVFKEVRITSDQPYNTVYPAGALLNDIIGVSWDARVQDSNINSLMINDDDSYGLYYFKFKIAPDSIRAHNITIEYIFTDGREVSSSIKGLKIGN